MYRRAVHRSHHEREVPSAGVAMWCYGAIHSQDGGRGYSARHDKNRAGTASEGIARSDRLLQYSPFLAACACARCLGLYGVMAYGVIRRTREIAIRMAIGAPRQSVVWLVVRETFALIVVGAVLGTATALLSTHYIRNQLFGVAAGDPLALSSAVFLLLMVAAAAGYVPARRATRIDPIAALRYE